MATYSVAENAPDGFDIEHLLDQGVRSFYDENGYYDIEYGSAFSIYAYDQNSRVFDKFEFRDESNFLGPYLRSTVTGASVSYDDLYAAVIKQDNAVAELIFAGKDTLKGSDRNDVLRGYAGADKLIGGIGADDLYGGDGKDVFVFRSVSDSSKKNPDRVFDFSRKDLIDLNSIDANGGKKGCPDFQFIQDNNFHKRAGELRYDHKGDDTYVYGDTNGDGKADLAIRFDGHLTLRATDFDV